MQMDSGVAMRVHVGEPAFRPAYGSPGMLVVGDLLFWQLEVTY